jgi:hypothetical protein
MKKILALGIPVLVLLGVVIALAKLEGRRRPDWETTLGDYISRSAQRGEVIEVHKVVDASRPWHFAPEMGRAVRSNWTWQIVQLPFPPKALRCVLVERKRTSALGVPEAPKRQVIYVAYHTDELWRAGWLVHEGPQEPFAAELVADLQAIGCDLDLQ